MSVLSGVRRQGLARALRLSVALGVAALTACSGLPKSEEVAGDAFARGGRFAISATEFDGRQQAVQGGFRWQDNGRDYVLDLTNPLGSIEARVEGAPGHALLTRANGSTLQASDPDSLVEDALGSPVPVSDLRYWLRGRVAPQTSDVQRDEAGHPVQFVQNGWHARLSRYDTAGPRLLVLERQDAGRRILVRLVVDQP